MSRPHESGLVYFVADGLTLLVEASVYFISLLPAVAMVLGAWEDGVWRTVLALVVAWYLSALVFVLIIVGMKRILVGEIRPGRYLLTSKRALPWIGVDRLVKMVNRSPFRSLVIDNAFYRLLYLRGMGADVKSTLLLGQRVVIPEPYFLRAGHHVLIGDEAILSAHKVEHNVVTLEPIEIGDNVLIGARALILPGVKIGSNATIGAGAVVARGAVIQAGETWAGNPAVKLDLFGRRPAASKEPS
jgi:carbonic anhydrase/acetyltransferase-like protein (isoleucine patch superfamily)